MKIKTRLAIFFSKSAKAFMQMLDRQASHFPGHLANLVDNNIMRNIEKPDNIFAVTGTNGKTTTTNMISDILTKMNVEHTSNKLGSNIKNGIITTLVDGNKLFGGNKYTYSALEVDEIWCKTLLKELKPKTLTITNLFQDSFERNGNIFYVKDKIEEALIPGIKLILNASDAISSNFDNDNEKLS